MEWKKLLSSLRVIPVLTTAALIVACGDGGGNGYGDDSNGGLNLAGTTSSIGYKLVWSDEFNVGDSIAANWNIESGYGPNNAGWGNDESQLYSDSADNLKIVADPNDTANGMLSITALCSAAECGKRDGSITSARINTKDKLEFRYGNIQARIKVPNGKSTWPAFWMLGANFPETSWPQSGEIDIMEVFQSNSNINTVHTSAHWHDANVSNANNRASFTDNKELDQPLSDDFHIYELEWTEKKLTGKIDGSTYYERTIDPVTMEEFRKPFFLLLNVAVDGTLGGEPDAIKTMPQEMLVDWVRVYREDKPVSLSVVRDDIAAAADTLSHTRIINSQESGGNSVVVDISNTSVAPFQGDTAIKLDYESAQAAHSGAAFTYPSTDISHYNTLSFLVNTDSFPGFADLELEFVDDRNTGGSSILGKQSVKLSSYPPVNVDENWRNYQIPLRDFPNVSFDKIKQFGFWNPVNDSDALASGIIYLDRLLLNTTAGNGAAPVDIAVGASIPSAPVPTAAASDVIALFSDQYTQISNVNYNPDWGQTTVYTTESLGGGDDVIKLSSLNYQGIDFGNNQQDLSAMTTLHVDFFTAEEIAANTVFRIKLVDFGADGSFQGGDDSEHELSFSVNSSPALAANQWVSLDLPLSAFNGLNSVANMAQFIVSGTGLDTVYLDNIYFYNNGGGGVNPGNDSGTGSPTAAPAADAPVPAHEANNVTAIFSDTYTAINGVDFTPDWGQSTVVSTESINGNPTLQYTSLNFQGIDFSGNAQDLSAMNALRFDVWTPDNVANAQLKIKLVDFGADGNFQGGDDSEHELTLDADSTPALTAGNWVSYDIPLSAFSGLTSRMNVAQLVISGANGLSTVYLDNIYFHSGAGTTVIGADSGTDGGTDNGGTDGGTDNGGADGGTDGGGTDGGGTDNGGTDNTCTAPAAFDDGLLTNGDFQNGAASWTGSDGMPNVQEIDCNNVNYANLETAAANPWDVNIQQVVAITQGRTYTLSFKARSDRNRPLTAGIGLNEGAFDSATDTVNLTPAWQTFTLNLSAAAFGSANSRVFFDMGAAAGEVVIDEVRLVDSGSSGPVCTAPAAFDDGLLTNGDFQSGAASWTGTDGLPDVQEIDCNNVSYANLATAAQNPWDVNIQQSIAITQGRTYQLSFKARSDRNRPLTAGIGLNEGGFESATDTVSLTPAWQTFTLDLSASAFGSANSRVFFDMGAAAGEVVIDEVRLVDSGSSGPVCTAPAAFNSGLLTNGDFQSGAASWTGTDGLPDVQEIDCNNVSYANLATAAQNPWDVNIQQSIAITQGRTYQLSFKARSDRNRPLTAGIGLNEGGFESATDTVSLTTAWQTFTLDLSANAFGSANSRVFFDMGAAAGEVVIDEVSLVDVGGGSCTAPPAFNSGLLSNGDFQSGATNWTGTAGMPNVQELNCNNVNYANLETAANNPWDVNVQQVVAITGGSSYTLSFRARSDRNRPLDAGIGLNAPPWSAAKGTVNLTPAWQTFTLSLTAVDENAMDFGGANSRVFFDMGAAAGEVVIDNVSLVLQ